MIFPTIFLLTFVLSSDVDDDRHGIEQSDDLALELQLLSGAMIPLTIPRPKYMSELNRKIVRKLQNHETRKFHGDVIIIKDGTPFVSNDQLDDLEDGDQLTILLFYHQDQIRPQYSTQEFQQMKDRLVQIWTELKHNQFDVHCPDEIYQWMTVDLFIPVEDYYDKNEEGITLTPQLMTTIMDQKMIENTLSIVVGIVGGVGYGLLCKYGMEVYNTLEWENLCILQDYHGVFYDSKTPASIKIQRAFRSYRLRKDAKA